MATLPKQVTKTVYFAVSTEFKTESHINKNFINVFPCDMSNMGYVNVLVKDITVDLPGSVDLVTGALEELEKDKIKLLAQVKSVEDKIAELTALPSPQGDSHEL